jgi:hypothetical protein
VSFVIGSAQDSLDAAESMEGKKIERESSPGQLDASSAVRGRETGVPELIFYLPGKHRRPRRLNPARFSLRLSYSARYQASLVPAFCPRVLAKPSPL